MKSSYFWGILIILLGLALLLNNLGVIDIDIWEIISTYWPVIFIIAGLELVFEKSNRKLRSNLLVGAILIILGLSIVGRNMGLFYFSFSLLWNIFWPLVLILIGINLLRAGTISKDSNWAVMSGIEKTKHWKLSNENYIALLGGIDLDLDVAEIPEGETYLQLTAVLGGIDIRAPKDVDIICRNTSILGGIDFFHEGNGGIFSSKEYEHKANVETKKKIIINSLCFMGGIEIR